MSRPTPRRVRFTTFTQGMRRGMLSFWLVLFLLLARQAVYDVKDLTLLSQKGETVYAPVVSRSNHKTKGKDKCRTLYSVVIEGVTMSRETTEDGMCPTYVTEDMYPFVYLPNQPSVYREGTVGDSRVHDQQSNWIFWLIAGMSTLALIIWAVEASYREQRFFWEYGTLVTAKVIRRWEVKGGKTTSYYMEYVFQTEAGRSIRTEKSVGSSTSYPVESLLSILYDPNNPSNNNLTEWCAAAEIVETTEAI
jgi:hypothetical protein